jgi:hypothetical protein
MISEATFQSSSIFIQVMISRNGFGALGRNENTMSA